ncbi:predicted protein [Botrytis cinerea T4]|uniref:Uncharacterized protein n=1 Tax=Botryotinia fuckeliana (strain T4) TaxID=999810 RepID=G2YCP8_BOTF4|nr:predicted protein [Botrytis cinerea T4]
MGANITQITQLGYQASTTLYPFRARPNLTREASLDHTSTSC